MREVCVNYFYSKIVLFQSILEKYELISQKDVSGEMRKIIQQDQWILFISEYGLSNAEINKYKKDTFIKNRLIWKDVSFIRHSN